MSKHILCTGCKTSDPGAFDDPDNDLCVACEEEHRERVYEDNRIEENLPEEEESLFDEEDSSEEDLSDE